MDKLVILVHHIHSTCQTAHSTTCCPSDRPFDMLDCRGNPMALGVRHHELNVCTHAHKHSRALCAVLKCIVSASTCLFVLRRRQDLENLDALTARRRGALSDCVRSGTRITHEYTSIAIELRCNSAHKCARSGGAMQRRPFETFGKNVFGPQRRMRFAY